MMCLKDFLELLWNITKSLFFGAVLSILSFAISKEKNWISSGFFYTKLFLRLEGL